MAKRMFDRVSSLSFFLVDQSAGVRLAQGWVILLSGKTDSGKGNGSDGKLCTALARDTMVWKRLCDAIVRTFTSVSGADNAKA